LNKFFALLLAVFSFATQATLIDFQDLPQGSPAGSCASLGSDRIASGGFMFGGNPAAPALSSCAPGAVGANTSDALLNANDLSIFTMTQWGGTAFSLNFFDAGNRTQPQWYSSSGGVQVVGYLADGDPVTQSFYFNGDAFGQFLLNSQFTNLIMVTFTSIGGGNSEFLLDNIGVNGATPTSVPEPGTLLLVMIGLAGLVFTNRSRARIPPAK